MFFVCPSCHGKEIGKIGTHQYYCWKCFIELTLLDNQLQLFEVEEDGSLSSLADLFPTEEVRYNTLS